HRDAPGPSGQAAARAGGARRAPARRDESRADRLPLDLLDQSQSGDRGARWLASSGSLLPDQHGDHRGPGPARAARRHPDPRARPSPNTPRPLDPLGPGAYRRRPPPPWPGNARELQHAIERAVLVPRGREIPPADLPGAPQHLPADGGATPTIAPSEVPSGSL